MTSEGSLPDLRLEYPVITIGVRIDDQMAEIIMVTDIYDAPRSYRPTSYDKRADLEEITGMAKNGKINFDIAKALISHNRKKQPQISECIISKQKRGTPPTDNQYGIIVNEDT